jgi:hypothetical protein
VTKSTGKYEKRLTKLSEAEFTLYRADPNREESLGVREYVVCRECGRRPQALSTGHLRAHGLTAKGYGQKWPDAPLYSPEAKTKRLNHQRRWVSRQDPQRLKAYKRAEYLAHKSERLAAARKWAKDHPDKRKEIGAKFRRTHHAAELERGRNWHERQRKLLQAAWRPSNWERKPILWQIVGNQLLSRGDVTNKEIARQLDSISVPCPYGKNADQRTWQRAVNEKSFLQLMRRIRIWVKRPGRTTKPKTTRIAA